MKIRKSLIILPLATIAILSLLAFSNDNRKYQLSKQISIFNAILKELDLFYVDTIQPKKMVDKGIDAMLKNLDPYTEYYSEDDADDLKLLTTGKYAGIGSVIRFHKGKNTTVIASPYEGMPAAKAGLKIGDLIQTIDGTDIHGMGIDSVSNMLRGTAGTTLTLEIERPGEKKPKTIKLTRESISMPAISYYGIQNGNIGYIQLESFTENCARNMRHALIELKNKGAEAFIIDLRGNGGGYLGIALEMANQFLEAGDIIVYTEGAHNDKSIERANGRGLFTDAPVVILVDETSASASEIIAGTIQDNDRGTVIGRRSFGKGLVQQPVQLSDGSIIRLTIARYHTPSGRCIQKPYNKGDREEYDKEILERYSRGEIFSQDSVHQNEELIYKTKKGRTVYGGGGIMPDIFVAGDTTHLTTFAGEALARGLISQFALKYSNSNRHNLAQYNQHETLVNALEREMLYNKFIEFATSKGLTADSKEIAESEKLIKRSLHSNIIYQLLGMREHVRYRNLSDSTVLKAVEVLEKGEAFPE